MQVNAEVRLVCVKIAMKEIPSIPKAWFTTTPTCSYGVSAGKIHLIP